MNNYEISEKADSIIKTHVMFATGAGLIPLPIVDLFGVTAVQLDMIKQLAELYGTEFNKEAGKSIIGAIGGSVLARLGASAIKAIPGVGTFIGELAMGATSAASTYAIGKVFKAHFEGGGTFDDFDTEQAKKLFKEKMEEGKEYVKRLYKEKKLDKEKAEDLKRIQELYARNLLTKEQYEEMVNKIFSEE